MKIFFIATLFTTLAWANSVDDEIIQDLDFFRNLEMVQINKAIPLEELEHLNTIAKSDEKEKSHTKKEVESK